MGSLKDMSERTNELPRNCILTYANGTTPSYTTNYSGDSLVHWFPNFLARGPLLPSLNNHESSHPCSRKYSVRRRGKQNKKFRSLRIHTGSICNNALHDLTVIKPTVARFVVIASFLIRYSKGHTK